MHLIIISRHDYWKGTRGTNDGKEKDKFRVNLYETQSNSCLKIR